MASRFRNIANLRYLSTNVPKASKPSSTLKNNSYLTAPGEDVASYVRFNRAIAAPQVADYEELLEPFKYDDRKLAIAKAKIHLICCEFDYLIHTNMAVPSKLDSETMAELLRIGSKERRQERLLKEYFQDAVKLRTQVKKAIKQENRPEHVDFKQGSLDDDGNVQYGLWKNCLFLRVEDGKALKTQAAINTKLYSPKLIIDWRFPVKLLDNSQDSPAISGETSELTNKSIKERSRRNFAREIFILCNHNLKLCNRAFNIVHYGLEDSNPFKPYLLEIFNQSSFDRRFFETIDSLPTDSEIHYMTAFGDSILGSSQPNSLSGSLTHFQASPPPAGDFMVSPYTELYQLERYTAQELFARNRQSLPLNVHFYRWPTESYVRKGVHIVLKNHINCLREVVFDHSTWFDSMARTIGRKYFTDKEILKRKWESLNPNQVSKSL